ncbi:hypothetical protein GBAR_LOCUS3622 [Geodia barretti]|uniref:Uncharacterized protein n=1 Tax=Geodia barretti TaxID=519541 RepID=A0AA35R3W9_GEOBA|nr:hypothetical protein GBAR_LOCUS3622 [Geodia barretti]
MMDIAADPAGGDGAGHRRRGFSHGRGCRLSGHRGTGLRDHPQRARHRRYPGQQRRHSLQQQGRGNRSGRVAPAHGGEPGRRLLSHTRPAPGHAQAALGPRGERLLAGHEDRRPHRRNRLHRLQRRPGCADLLPRAGGCGRRHHRQRGRAGIRADTHGHRAAHQRSARGTAPADPGGPLLRAGGGRAPDRISGVAPRGFHHRRDHRHQRRSAHGLAAADELYGVLRLRFATPVLSLVEGLRTNGFETLSPFALSPSTRLRTGVARRSRAESKGAV